MTSKQAAAAVAVATPHDNEALQDRTLLLLLLAAPSVLLSRQIIRDKLHLGPRGLHRRMVESQTEDLVAKASV